MLTNTSEKLSYSQLCILFYFRIQYFLMIFVHISPQIESSPEKKMRLKFFLISSPGGSKLDQVDSDFHKTMLIF